MRRERIGYRAQIHLFPYTFLWWSPCLFQRPRWLRWRTVRKLSIDFPEALKHFCFHLNSLPSPFTQTPNAKSPRFSEFPQGIDSLSLDFIIDILRMQNDSTHRCSLDTQRWLTKGKISELPGIEIPPHPAYGPDLAQSDYHLFRSMAHVLRGQDLRLPGGCRKRVSRVFRLQTGGVVSPWNRTIGTKMEGSSGKQWHLLWRITVA